MYIFYACKLHDVVYVPMRIELKLLAAYHKWNIIPFPFSFKFQVGHGIVLVKCPVLLCLIV